VASRQQGKRGRARRKARTAAVQELARRCPCGKVSAASRGEAERKYVAASWLGGRGNRVRFYECAFGAWHWTRQLERGLGERAAKGRSAEEPAPTTEPPDPLTAAQRAWIEELAAEAARTEVPATAAHDDEASTGSA
jgi:hypothetical protein